VMHGHEKSDSAIVAKKLPNKAGQPAAEAVERRAGTKGNTGQQSTRRAQIRESVFQALERVRKAARQRSLARCALRRQAPKVGAECLNWARSDLCGGRGAILVPTAIISIEIGFVRKSRVKRTGRRIGDLVRADANRRHDGRPRIVEKWKR
jgi:hypothetical protein